MKNSDRKGTVRRGAKLVGLAMTLALLAACVCCSGCIIVSW